MTTENPVREKSYALALEIIKICRFMQKSHEYVISKQLLKSGTSIAANIEEGLQGQSRADFIAKFSISHKESFETQFWLRLIVDSSLVPATLVSPAKCLLQEVLALLTSILKTAKQNNL